MLFTHDVEQGLRSAAELINTGRNDRELLPDVAALPPLLDRYGWTGRRDGDDAELAAVKALRPGWAISGRVSTTRSTWSGRSTPCLPTPMRRRG